MPLSMSRRMKADRRGVLSALWAFVLFNMLFRDIHELLRPGAIEEFMSATVSEATLLASGVALSTLISMVVLSRVLPHRANRWANLGVAVLALGSMLALPPNDLDDAWFLGVEIVGLAAIMWLASTWRAEAAVTTEPERASTA